MMYCCAVHGSWRCCLASGSCTAHRREHGSQKKHRNDALRLHKQVCGSTSSLASVRQTPASKRVLQGEGVPLAGRGLPTKIASTPAEESAAKWVTRSHLLGNLGPVSIFDRTFIVDGDSLAALRGLFQHGSQLLASLSCFSLAHRALSLGGVWPTSYLIDVNGPMPDSASLT